ncbi:hypothetical protein B0H13DRAFT_2143565 [Mycena leptocephala]|nr:hypothetical protein B0H13DRAFT_2143565 [Mycena leptocephala]
MTLKSGLDDISRYRNAYFLALSVALGSLFYGYDMVLSLGSFQHYFGLDKMNPSEKAWLNGNIVAILQVGCLFGALGVGSLSSRYGRKPCLLASGVVYIIGSAIQVIVGLGRTREHALDLLYAGRFLGGIGVGMVTALVPSYVSECTPRAIRGRCTGLIQLAINMGMLLLFGSTTLLQNIAPGESQWRVPFAIQIPESPRYMVEKDEYDSAARTLAFLSRTTPDDPIILATIEEIKADFVALRSFIPALVMFFQQWTGTNAINYFSPQIFASLGISETTAGLFATGRISNVVSVSLGIGRKKCLIMGGLGQAAMMLWIGGYSAIHPATTPVTVSPWSYISIVAVYLYAAFYSAGWGPIPWIVAAEVAPNHLRTAVISIATGLTPIMLNELDYGTFLVFGFCCLIMAFWAWLCLPNSGFGLEEIGLLFEKDVSCERCRMRLGSHFHWKQASRSVAKLPSVSTIRVEDLEEADSSDSKLGSQTKAVAGPLVDLPSSGRLVTSLADFQPAPQAVLT